MSETFTLTILKIRLDAALGCYLLVFLIGVAISTGTDSVFRKRSPIAVVAIGFYR